MGFMFYSYRLTAVECLHIVGRKIFEGKSLNQYISFSFALLNLLSDDDSSIRAKASMVVSQLHQVVEKVKQSELLTIYLVKLSIQIQHVLDITRLLNIFLIPLSKLQNH